jgi:hypothetical protein
MGFIKLNLYRHGSGATLDPKEAARYLQGFFPEAAFKTGDQLALRAQDAESQFADELRDNPEGPARIVVETLWRNTKEFGPAYAFELPLGPATNLRGTVRRYDITFLFEEPLSAELQDRILAFLKSFGVGRLEIAPGATRQSDIICDMPGPLSLAGQFGQDVSLPHEQITDTGAA